MVGRFRRRSAKFDLKPWMLKQVQHDEVKGPLPTPRPPKPGPTPPGSGVGRAARPRVSIRVAVPQEHGLQRLAEHLRDAERDFQRG